MCIATRNCAGAVIGDIRLLGDFDLENSGGDAAEGTDDCQKKELHSGD